VLFLGHLSSPASGCSFLVSNYNLTAQHGPDVVRLANWWQRWRGPDATNVAYAHGWAFLHNLLSMTGTFTPQPFVSDDGRTIALFNGEIYNYRRLAKALTGSSDSFGSDGHVLLPAYAKWGEEFLKNLHGEFAIVLVDFATQRVILSTDAFSTKPLWYASWVDHGAPRFLAASYESALTSLGAPRHARRMAEPNQAVVLSFGPGRDHARSFRATHRFPLVTWDLRQHKDTTDDFISALRRAVAVRTRETKHRAFIGLSSGYDSGAIMLALHLQEAPFLACGVRGHENSGVLHEREQFCARTAEVRHTHSIYLYIHTYIHTYMYTHIYIHIYLSICICIYIYRSGSREREKEPERQREIYIGIHIHI